VFSLANYLRLGLSVVDYELSVKMLSAEIHFILPRNTIESCFAFIQPDSCMRAFFASAIDGASLAVYVKPVRSRQIKYDGNTGRAWPQNELLATCGAVRHRNARTIRGLLKAP
jgi:hypothetical protein